MGKKAPENKLQNIEEALDRISCSLASISGTLDNVYTEIMKEKKEEQLKESSQPHFDNKG